MKSNENAAPVRTVFSQKRKSRRKNNPVDAETAPGEADQRRPARARESLRTLFDAQQPDEPAVRLPLMPLGQHVAHDYLTTGLSLKAHPVSLVRTQLAGVTPAAQLTAALAGRWISIAGLVTCRQRPDTASGVVFVTLEDETGYANLIVRPPVYERFRHAIRYATLLRVRGRVEGNDKVIHLLVHEAVNLSHLLPGVPVASHDFH